MVLITHCQLYYFANFFIIAIQKVSVHNQLKFILLVLFNSKFTMALFLKINFISLREFAIITNQQRQKDKIKLDFRLYKKIFSYHVLPKIN